MICFLFSPISLTLMCAVFHSTRPGRAHLENLTTRNRRVHFLCDGTWCQHSVRWAPLMFGARFPIMLLLSFISNRWCTRLFSILSDSTPCTSDRSPESSADTVAQPTLPVLCPLLLSGNSDDEFYKSRKKEIEIILHLTWIRLYLRHRRRTTVTTHSTTHWRQETSGSHLLNLVQLWIFKPFCFFSRTQTDSAVQYWSVSSLRPPCWRLAL